MQARTLLSLYTRQLQLLNILHDIESVSQHAPSIVAAKSAGLDAGVMGRSMATAESQRCSALRYLALHTEAWRALMVCMRPQCWKAVKWPETELLWSVTVLSVVVVSLLYCLWSA